MERTNTDFQLTFGFFGCIYNLFRKTFRNLKVIYNKRPQSNVTVEIPDPNKLARSDTKVLEPEETSLTQSTPHGHVTIVEDTVNK